jgi:voltage-gated potassium channel
MQHGLRRFQDDPASPRNAALVIGGVTILAVLVGSLVIWLFDRRDFPDFGTAFWYALQTVTTVGYGDVTPVTGLGRFVGGVVMIVAIAFLTIVTALVTSTFVEAERRRREASDTAVRQGETDRLHERFDQIIDRLTAIEARLGVVEPDAPRPADPDPTPDTADGGEPSG